jgi:hypothetical protein
LIGIPLGLGAGWRRADNTKERDEKEPDKDERRKGDVKSKKNEERLEPPSDAPSGWTSLLEEWFCNGHWSNPQRTPSPNQAEISLPKPLAPRSPSKEQKKGPYQLLVKERMMGIYLAVFIHRDLKPLVKGQHQLFLDRI